ncbi:alpha/beta hydrolase [Aliiruegeria haliotis]|nr:alpha/beta fold hydrolase [Aliiruegeria haliotis]
MSDPECFETPQGRRIAFHLTCGAGPLVVFLGGFRSDMSGTKALHLQNWAERRQRAFLRLDYSGHGKSSGEFEDGCIGDWATDAAAVLRAQSGPMVLVGSSMGAWISLLLARLMPERIAGMVTIAAAPDFTEDSMWAALPDARKTEVKERGYTVVPTEYGDLKISRRLIEDGRTQLVLRSPLVLPFPVRSLHGTADADVDMSVALRLLEHAEGGDIQLRLVKGADHRFSRPQNLSMIEAAIEEVLARGEAA